MISTKGTYHYEWAAYTNNLCWGRVFICRSKNLSFVKHTAANAGKGCFDIVKVRVPNAA